MIVEAKVERFRGIQQLRVQGLGYVNLIIGKNDCGKTAFMEALELADSPRDAPAILITQQMRRMGKELTVGSFERTWRPIFWNHEQEAGAAIEIVQSDGTASRIAFRAPPASGALVISQNDEHALRGAGEDLLASKAWTIEFLAAMNGNEERFSLVRSASGLKFPDSYIAGSPWIRSSANIGSDEVQHASIIKQEEREREFLDILRTVDDGVSGIELLAPDGKTAELFVRLQGAARPLPLTLMGEGFQRCFEISSAAVANSWPVIFIDEIDNGLHHLAIQPLWEWLSAISTRRNLQVFATTHSEECIGAACRAFTARNDDRLRVVRLDRHADYTSAAVYDRSLVRTAIEAGVEIRG